MSEEKKKYAITRFISNPDEDFCPYESILDIVKIVELTDDERSDMENKLKYKSNIEDDSEGDYYRLIEINHDKFEDTIVDKVNSIMTLFKFDSKFTTIPNLYSVKDDKPFMYAMQFILGGKYDYYEIIKHKGLIVHKTPAYLPYLPKRRTYVIFFNIPIDTKEDYDEFIKRIRKETASYIEKYKDKVDPDKDTIIYLD